MWTFDGDALRSAIQSVAALATDKDPFIRAEFADGGLVVVGDDTATQARVRIAAEESGTPFNCGMPAALAARVLKRVKGGSVKIGKHGDRIGVTQDMYEATIKIADEPPLRLDGFPDLAGAAKRDRLCAAFDAVLPAVCGDDTSSLHGVRLEHARGDSWAVATDKYRMHAVMLTGRLGFTQPITVPPQALKMVRSTVTSPMVSLGTVDEMFYLSGDGSSIATRGIAGQWIKDWASFIRPPADVETFVVFDAPELLEAVRSVEEPLQAKTVTLELLPDTNRVVVSAITDEGTATASCSAEVTNGASVLEYHAPLLVDALKQLGSRSKMTVPFAIQPTHFASANDAFQALVSPNTTS